jgi:hypothetical protein
VNERVGFLLSIEDSFGEREHGVRFARELPASGYRPVFVIPEKLAAYFGRIGMEHRVYHTDAEAWALLEELDPALLVCCEYFNLSEELRARVNASRWPLATTDGTGLAVEINTNPLRSPVAMRKLEVPERLLRLRPCPVNDPRPDGGGIFHYALYPDLRPGDRERTRATWELAPGTRLALFAIAPWARGAAYLMGRMDHYWHLIRVVAEALDAAGEPFELVVVVGTRAERQVGRGRVRWVELLLPDRYEELLLGCDLLVTDNVIQTSASKAFVAGVPAIALINSRAGGRGSPLAHVYNMFPLAVRFPSDSAYYRALEPVELGDPAGVRARIAAALRGDPDRGADYRAALAGLRGPAQIIDEIMGRS